MSDPLVYRKLLDCLERPDGRKAWLTYKLRGFYLDLSTADFTDHSLRDYDLAGVNLSAAIFLESELAGADLSDADLSLADLRRANLRNANLGRANLEHGNLQGAILLDAQLEDACLTGTRLLGADLTGADLSGADLAGADLRGASLKYARLVGACLARANVAQADLTGAVLDAASTSQMKNYDQAIISNRDYRRMGLPLSAQADTVLEPGAEMNPQSAPDSVELPGGPRVEDQGPMPFGGDIGIAPELPGTGFKGFTARLPIPFRSGSRRQEGELPPGGVPGDINTLSGCRLALGVSESASPIEIVKAFRRKAKMYHPDMVRHLPPEEQERAAEEFQRVRQAFETLTHHSSRPLKAIHWPEGLRRGLSPYEYSIADFDALARLNPGNTSILYNLAWRYFEDGRHEEACAGFQRVLDINPNDEDARYNLTVVKLFIDLALPPLLSWNRP